MIKHEFMKNIFIPKRYFAQSALVSTRSLVVSIFFPNISFGYVVNLVIYCVVCRRKSQPHCFHKAKIYKHELKSRFGMVVKAIDAKDVILEVPTEAKTEIYQKFVLVQISLLTWIATSRDEYCCILGFVIYYYRVKRAQTKCSTQLLY